MAKQYASVANADYDKSSWKPLVHDAAGHGMSIKEIKDQCQKLQTQDPASRLEWVQQALSQVQEQLAKAQAGGDPKELSEALEQLTLLLDSSVDDKPASERTPSAGTSSYLSYASEGSSQGKAHFLKASLTDGMLPTEEPEGRSAAETLPDSVTPQILTSVWSAFEGHHFRGSDHTLDEKAFQKWILGMLQKSQETLGASDTPAGQTSGQTSAQTLGRHSNLVAKSVSDGGSGAAGHTGATSGGKSTQSVEDTDGDAPEKGDGPESSPDADHTPSAGLFSNVFGQDDITSLLMRVLMACYDEQSASLRELANRLDKQNKKKSEIRNEQTSIENKLSSTAGSSDNQTAVSVDGMPSVKDAATAKAKMDELTREGDTVGDDAQKMQMQLQDKAQKLQELIGIMSNAIKSRHDSSMAVINNIK